MGYSTSLQTLKDFYVHVQPLEKGESYMWYLSADSTPRDAAILAYKIRECFYIAKLYPDAFPDFTKVAERFSVEVVDRQKVQARITSKPTEAQILTSHASPQAGGQINEVAGKALATAGEQTEFTIIETWTQAAKSGNSNSRLHFPQARLDYGQLCRLWSWARARKPGLMLMVDGEAVTVGPIEDEIVEYSWKPSSEDIPPEPETTKTSIVPPRPY